VRTISFVPIVPEGMVSVTDVEVFEALVAAVPPMVEVERLPRFVPVTTVVPPPASGLDVTDTPVIVGGGR
jgi:hypothetical protein